ncbi:MAG: nickel/cobalt transporter [Bauldia sp.]
MRRPALAIAAFGLAIVAAGAALGQAGPFGVGAPEPALAPIGSGFFGSIFAQIAAWQSEFYRTLTDTLGNLKTDGSAFFLLAGVSFLYGVFHAAGPGHGKAVIGAYLLASGETLRRGIVISFVAAFVQAIAAVALVSIAAGILRVTAVEMTAATNVLEIASYALIVLVGLWLLYAKLRGRGHVHAARWEAQPVPAGATGDAAMLAIAHDGHDHSGVRLGGRYAATAEAGSAHAHVADPALLRRPLTFASAWSAVLAVGIRPCSGALIILVFALSQGLYPAGIASTFVMAIGTGLTVAILASLAVVARDAAIRLSGSGRSALASAIRVAEILAALALVVLGGLLLGGAVLSGT